MQIRVSGVAELGFEDCWEWRWRLCVALRTGDMDYVLKATGVPLDAENDGNRKV